MRSRPNPGRAVYKMVMTGLSRIRSRALTGLALLSWLWTATFAVAAISFPLANEAATVALSVLLSAGASVFAWRRRYDGWAAWLVAVSPALQPALLVWLLEGHPWQMEGHMYFFAGLAAVALTCDWRPIIVATGLIAGHHLLLSELAPAALFIGNHGHLDRVLIHALAVLIVCGLLGRTARLLQASFDDQERTASERDAMAQTAEAERRRSDAVEHEATEARRAAMLGLADDLDESIGRISDAIAAAADQLTVSAGNMSRFAEQTGNDAREVASVASSTKEAVTAVAEEMTGLARTIGQAADDTDSQVKLSEDARERSVVGEEAIRALASRADEMNALVEFIQRVSFQTDMLALNAAVEAGRAGQAGQGFAVVANEVKALSSTSRGATDRINLLIGGVSSGAIDADRALAEASRVLGQLTGSAASVGQVMREQRGVAAAIEARASDSARAVAQIASRFDRVAQSSAEAVRMAAEIRTSAEQLANVAGDLQTATQSQLAALRAA